EKQNKYLTEAGAELVKTEAELAQAKENMAGRADPVERSRLRAPLRGIVKNIRVNTLGGVVSAGQDIMEIIPLEDQLLIEAYINPRDVAYVRTGMPALVKLTAYDYAIYGGLDGVVTLVSPDTLRDQKRPGDLKLDPNEAYYRVLVTTSNNYLTDRNGKRLPVIPGMIASVDIKTGRKTVFQYLIKPITRMKQALQER
ncbi:HlyD family efflux transporter periplasmic adaptor subunit, partial [Escherichia coli]|nr:HlyD family efflux transporter periplasmic adaptor subunit [Escherichia coli]